jgi:hypothetical protein
MSKGVRVFIRLPSNYWYLIIVYKRRFETDRKTALSIDIDGDPTEKVNVLSATGVRL